ncbi:hypothetical protein ES703_95470 [subsurface metagenome]
MEPGPDPATVPVTEVIAGIKGRQLGHLRGTVGVAGIRPEVVHLPALDVPPNLTRARAQARTRSLEAPNLTLLYTIRGFLVHAPEIPGIVFQRHESIRYGLPRYDVRL